jgi:hypothetical protein
MFILFNHHIFNHLIFNILTKRHSYPFKPVAVAVSGTYYKSNSPTQQRQ